MNRALPDPHTYSDDGSVTGRTCARCGEWKIAALFPIDPSRPGRLYAYCLACKAKYMRDRRAAGIAADPDYDRRQNLRRKYGITPEEFDALLDVQGGRCAICGSDIPKHNGGRFVVDHDHETGAVRGLLCGPCNSGLGSFGDDPERLTKAVDYLRNQRRQS